MIIKTPNIFFLTCGNSEGFSLLNAFDGALLNSGIGDMNLVRLSSILPPYCQEVEKINIPYGSLVPTAYASITSDIPGDIISSAVAVGVSEDPNLASLIMEYSARADKETVEIQVRKMAEEGMKFRNRNIKEIKSISATHKVISYGATFAAVILWSN